MNVKFVVSLLAAGMAASGQVPSYKSLQYPPLRDIKIPPVATFTLSNGIRLYLLEDHEFPTSLCTGPNLDSTTVRETLERARTIIGWDDFAEQQRTARVEGRYLGLGLASFIEIAPGPPNFALMAGFDL